MSKKEFKEKDPKIPFKEKIKDKNYKRFVILFVLALIFSVISFKLDGYPKQAVIILVTFLYWFAFRFLKKYNNSQGKFYVRDFFRGIGRYIRQTYEKIKEKAIELLGLKPRSAFIKGKDEKDIVIDRAQGIFDKILNLRNRPKWKDMQTNAQKVRFIYQKFLVKISKKGYKLMASDTHNDVQMQAVKFSKRTEKELEPLFTSYENARYTRNPDITDNTVEEIKKI